MRCPGAKSTHFSITPVVSFPHVHAISSRLQCNTADLPSGHWVPTLPSQYPGYQRKQSTWPWTSNNSWSWRWCWLPLHWLSFGFRITRKYPSFSTSNYQIQQMWFIINALQKVQTQFLATFFSFIWQQFWNHFAQNFLMFNSSVRTRQTLSLSKLTSSATAQTPNLRFFWITSHTFSMFSSVTAVCGRPGRSSSFTHSLPSENHLCHSNTSARDMLSSP